MTLVSKFLPWLLCGLFALGSVAHAQDEGGDPVPESAGGTGPRSGRKAPRTKVMVTVPVRGIDQDTTSRVQEEVEAMTQPLFACAKCRSLSRTAGACETCEEPRAEVEPTPLIAEAKLTTDRTALTLTLNPHHWGSLVELDAVLARSEASVRRDQFALPDYARVLVRAETGANAKKLRFALRDLGVFEEVSVVAQEDGQHAWILPREQKERRTVGELEEALAKLSTKYVVEDVQWAAYCGECGETASMQIGEPTCGAK